MKKNSLTTAVVAGIAGVAGLANVATAVNLNPDGLGQVLIYPYYGVNAGNATLVSVVNTTNETKAVKVRFLEALNSREVLDFNLYLSPFDVWTAAVTSSDDTGPGILSTSDTSCTVPAIPASGVAFRNFAYTGSFDDDGPNTLDRTREGHIEMIEMGVVEDTNGGAFNAATSFSDAATHVDGVPAGCARLVASWAAGQWSVDATRSAQGVANEGVTGPVGGLFGAAVIADIANGTALSYNADAVDGFYTLATTTLHTGPGFTTPSLSQAQTGLGEADAIVFDNGQLITLDFATGRPDAVSSVFMHDAIYNEYNTDASVGAASEWVVTFPTKRLHIESTTPAQRRPFTDNVDDTDGAGQVTPGGDAVDSLVFDPNGSCELIGVTFFDREEGPEAPAPVVDFSPLPEGEDVSLALCWETNVVTWNQEDAISAGESLVLGSRTVANNINLRDASGNDVTAGWVAMDFDIRTDVGGNRLNFLLDLGADGAGDTTGTTPRNQLFGLPVTGFWAANFVNANAAPGTLANYSVISRHRASRDSRSVTVTGTGDTEVIAPTGFAAS